MIRCKYCGNPIHRNNVANAWQHVVPYPYGLRFYCVMSGGVILREIVPAGLDEEDLPLEATHEDL